MGNNDDGPLWEKLNALEARVHDTELKVVEKLTSLETKLAAVLELAQTYVTKERFQTVQLVVFGMVAIIMTSVIGALLAQVLTKAPK